jgi:repressor LexA
MPNATTAERLRELLQKNGWRQADVLRLCAPISRALGVPLRKNDLSQYVSGKVEPGPEKRAVLCQALGVSEVWLMGYETTPPAASRSIPLVGSIACGRPILAAENITDRLPCPPGVAADFALRCRGDSMEGARLRDGDLVFIRSQPEVPNGAIAAVLIGDEATLKRWHYDPATATLTLSPENDAYAPLQLRGKDLENVRCLGLAVGFLSTL